MVKIARSAYIHYSAKQMFDLVDDIEAYPEFLPWCQNTAVLERTESSVTASICIQKSQFNKSFVTTNTLKRYENITMTLVEGPFRQLDGNWYFKDLDDEGSKITLNIEFEFKNRILGMTLGSFFEKSCNTLMDAFIQRAAQVYE
ncbi:uncharacterized protein METZ01_LOCUS168926, partial [marine metagenome]